MEIKEFLESLEKSNFSLVLDNEKLLLTGDKKKLSKEEIQAIRTNEFVINYIKENKNRLIEHLSVLPKEEPGEKKSKNIVAVYPLSGLQQGLLFYGLYDQHSGSYIEQLSCDITSADLAVFKKSWNYILKKHTILRSAFY